MNHSKQRHARWRRTVAAGFIASLAIHGAVLALVHLDGGLAEGEEARQARAAERAQEWDRQAMRVVEVREKRFDVGELAPRPPLRGAAAAAATTDRPSESADRPDASYGPAGSAVASVAFASLESASSAEAEADEADGAAGAAESARVVKSTGQPASIRPTSRRQGSTTYRPASSAARTAARSGEPPQLGDGAVVVDDRGRIPGRDGDRWGRRGGLSGSGGSCGTPGGAIIDRAIPDRTLIGR